MLDKLRVRGFKSLSDVDVVFPRLAVIFGPNAAGKSNLIDSIQALSRVGTSRTLTEALTEPIRGYPVESFSFPPGGLPELLSRPEATFTLDAVLRVGRDWYEYRIAVRIDPVSGALAVDDEYLATLNAKRVRKGNPSIERIGDELRIRRKSKPAHPRQEPLGLNHSLLSDPRLAGVEYRAIERCRNEISGWRAYYLDPRVAMRRAAPPAEVQDIGLLGQDIAPFLYRLRSEAPKRFDAAVRTLKTLVPSVQELSVDLDKRRGTLDIQIKQNGIDFSSRIVSEGTLRVLALSSLAVNPWGGSLLAFEEPENGVHPRRMELITDLLVALAVDQGRQVIVTTHSPLFADAMLRRAVRKPDLIGLFATRRTTRGTEVVPFTSFGPLFENKEVADALTSNSEDGRFESLLLRGLLDE